MRCGRARRRRGRRRAATRARRRPESRRTRRRHRRAASTRCASVTIDVQRRRIVTKANERLAERRLFDLETVPAGALGGDGLPPRLRAADRDDAAAARRCATEGAADRGLVRPFADRAGDDDVVRGVDVDANDAPRQLEICHDAGERRLVAATRRGSRPRRDSPRASRAAAGAPTASRPRRANGRWRSSSSNWCSAATRSSARVAAAISSGPTPSPARHATVLRHSILLHSLRRGRARRARTTPALRSTCAASRAA